MFERATSDGEETLGLIHKFRLSSDPHAPLAVFVHGRAGNVDVMAPFFRVVPEEWSIIAVQAVFAEPTGGYSWWDISDVTSRGTAMPKAAEALKNFVEKAPRWYGITPSKQIAIGFSQGAAILSYVMQQAPSLFNGIALLAGFVLEVRDRELVGPFPPVFMAHGIKDETVTIDKARNGRDYLQKLGCDVTFVEDDVGHKVGTKGMGGVRGWVGR